MYFVMIASFKMFFVVKMMQSAACLSVIFPQGGTKVRNFIILQIGGLKTTSKSTGQLFCSFEICYTDVTLFTDIF